MLVLPNTVSQLQPGTPVAAFPHEDASGCPIGFFGRVFAVRRRTALLPPEDLCAWTYVVKGPRSHGCIEVMAAQLLLVSPDEPPNEPQERLNKLERAWEVSFAGNADRNDDRLSGRYRLAGRNWARFDFYKCEDDVPRYELRLPANPLARETPALLWYAPANAVLDRSYVMRTLSELLGPEFQRSE